eukprot:5794424-Amphidinium_carterae.1
MQRVEEEHKDCEKTSKIVLTRTENIKHYMNVVGFIMTDVDVHCKKAASVICNPTPRRCPGHNLFG